MKGCRGSARHWFTIYGAVGAIRAICGHCRAIHPDILRALERGAYYARLYDPAPDSPDFGKDAQRKEADIRLIHKAIERVGNEESA